MRPDDTITLLERVRTRLVTKGWTPGPSRCLVAAFESVVPDAEWYGVALQNAAFTAMREVLKVESLPLWNAAQTSLDAILDAIDRTIIFVRESPA